MAGRNLSESIKMRISLILQNVHEKFHSQPYNCVPRSNAFIEQIFFLLNVQRTDERNSLKPSTVEAIVSIKANAGFSYNEAYDLFLKEKKLLEAVTSGAKYLS
uniref:Uncharacterized protein n=1 Tax=Acrobeloides nanus TaxID=290746 RepID=A0A914DQ09_9BILA